MNPTGFHVWKTQCETPSYKLAINRNLQLFKVAEDFCTVLKLKNQCIEYEYDPCAEGKKLNIFFK